MSTNTDTATVLESPEYGQTRHRLAEHPVVQQMAAELQTGFESGRVQPERFFHDGDYGSPRHEFMLHANTHFRAHDTDAAGARHIGAVAEAIGLILAGTAA